MRGRGGVGWREGGVGGEREGEGWVERGRGEKGGSDIDGVIQTPGTGSALISEIS